MTTAEKILKKSFDKNIHKKYNITWEESKGKDGHNWILVAMEEYAKEKNNLHPECEQDLAILSFPGYEEIKLEAEEYSDKIVSALEDKNIKRICKKAAKWSFISGAQSIMRRANKS